MSRWPRILMLRLRSMFRRAAVERDMQAEMTDHLASETEALVQRGIPIEQARRRALETMGRVDAIEEECRDARGVIWWDHLRHDVTCAVRLLIGNKAYAATAIATMALGIGSVSAVFSVVDAVLLRPLPYPHSERLISVEGLGMRGPFDVMRATSKVAEYAAYQGLRSYNLVPRELTIPERITGSEVSANFFAVLGVQALHGRTFEQGEDRPGRARVAVLSYRFWKQRYAGRPDVVGQQIVLDEVPYVITGVMGEHFQFPAPEAQLWTPLLLDPRSPGDYWGSAGTGMLARLRGDGTLDAAREELRVQVPLIRSMFPWRMPDSWGIELQVRELRDALVAGARLRGWMLLAAVGLVLVIAIVNVANLMIGNTTGRSRELALRASVGATPARLARQLLTEALVLTAAGGLAGVAVGYGQLSLLRSLLPPDTPRLSEVAMDGRAIMFAAGLSMLSGILVGLFPACRTGTRQLSVLTEDGGRGATLGVSRMRVDALLVITEAALATVLLVTSGLLLRSVWTMLQVDPGFRVESVVTAELSPGPSAAASAAKKSGLWQEVRGRLLAFPGVSEVAAMNVLPLTPRISAFAAAIEDHPVSPQEPQYVLWSTSVTPEHAEVLGIKLLAGRKFAASDRSGSEPVAIVSGSTARRFWPGQNPVGRRLKPVSDRAWRTIVGVVEDVKTFGLAGPPAWVDGEVYLPMAQSINIAAPVSLVIRAQGDPTVLESALPRLVYDVCATCAVSKIARMEQVVAQAVETPRSTAWLLAGFTLMALVIAAAGIYGVVNHAVVRRTRELGVRLALGAGRANVALLVLSANLRNVTIGCALGLGLGWISGRVIRNLLFGIAPHDWLSFAAAPMVLLLIALLAAAIPTMRAVRIDPVRSLREA